MVNIISLDQLSFSQQQHHTEVSVELANWFAYSQQSISNLKGNLAVELWLLFLFKWGCKKVALGQPWLNGLSMTGAASQPSDVDAPNKGRRYLPWCPPTVLPEASVWPWLWRQCQVGDLVSWSFRNRDGFRPEWKFYFPIFPPISSEFRMILGGAPVSLSSLSGSLLYLFIFNLYISGI